jgi:putative membrane protein
MRFLLAAVHFLALAIGLGSIWGRARALRGPLDSPGLRRVFYNDAWWGIAALLWLVTGFARAFGPFEKGPAYYLSTPVFYAKVGLFLVIFLLELWPMITFIGWRRRIGRGEVPDLSRAPVFSRISYVQATIVVVMVFVAAAMARGIA